jgi:hypothetical protein
LNVFENGENKVNEKESQQKTHGIFSVDNCINDNDDEKGQEF